MGSCWRCDGKSHRALRHLGDALRFFKRKWKKIDVTEENKREMSTKENKTLLDVVLSLSLSVVVSEMCLCSYCMRLCEDLCVYKWAFSAVGVMHSHGGLTAREHTAHKHKFSYLDVVHENIL